MRTPACAWTRSRDVIQRDESVKKVYLLNQDYSFGHDVSREAQRALKERRPDIAIVGDEFHPIGRVKDFAPYVAKIRASGADAVVTGNWGNDLTLLVKAAREQGLEHEVLHVLRQQPRRARRARRRGRKARGSGRGLASERGRRGVRRVLSGVPRTLSVTCRRLSRAAHAVDDRHARRRDGPRRQRRPDGRRPRARRHEVRQRLPRARPCAQRTIN